MSTAQEHQDEALSLLAYAEQQASEGEMLDAGLTVAQAQVHATLAVAAALRAAGDSAYKGYIAGAKTVAQGTASARRKG